MSILQWIMGMYLLSKNGQINGTSKVRPKWI